MSQNEIVVGDYVVAGANGEELDCGKIVSLDGNTAEIAWEVGACRTKLDLSLDDVSVYGSHREMLAEYQARRERMPVRHA